MKKSKKQITPRFSNGMKGYIIYSNETGRVIKRYRSIEEFKQKTGGK